MSQNTEWFEGRRRIERRPRLVLPVLAWVIVFLAAVCGTFLLVGCAQPSWQGTCALKPLGQNENGILIARVYCEASE